MSNEKSLIAAVWCLNSPMWYPSIVLINMSEEQLLFLSHQISKHPAAFLNLSRADSIFMSWTDENYTFFNYWSYGCWHFLGWYLSVHNTGKLLLIEPLSFSVWFYLHQHLINTGGGGKKKKRKALYQKISFKRCPSNRRQSFWIEVLLNRRLAKWSS